MRENANPVAFLYQQLSRSIAGLIFLSVIALPLFGCGEHEGGGPIISSLSTPTNTPSTEGSKPTSDFTDTDLPAEENQTTDLTSTESDSATDESEYLDALGPVPDTEGEEDPTVSVTPTPTGFTAQLTWDASTDPNVQGYFIHYGKQSPGEYGSCSYEQSQRVGAPPATITDLEPNTVYFVAISAFGESESEAETACSNEVLVVTSSAQG
jgi:hypothetical protein